MKHVLVLCTGNSCRSIMTEALINHLGNGKFSASSAGSFPTGKVHPMALKTLDRHEIPVTEPRSKSWDEFKTTPIDIVITVCDNAAGETCPVFPGAPLGVHWGMPDPADAVGSDEEVLAVFDKVFYLAKQKVEALLQVPIDALPSESLAAELNRIGAHDEHSR